MCGRERFLNSNLSGSARQKFGVWRVESGVNGDTFALDYNTPLSATPTSPPRGEKMA